MSQTLELIIRAKDEASAGLKKLKDGMTGLQAATAGVAIGGAVLAAEIAAVRSAYLGVVVPAQEYILAMADLADKAQLSTEEASRWNEVAENTRVNLTTLATGFRYLNEAGISPTIENVGAIADKFVSIEDPVKRAQFAVDVFGAKAGPEMSKLLAGGRAARYRYANSLEDSMLVTKDAADAAEGLSDSQDALNDSFGALAQSLGTGAIPLTTALINEMQFLVDGIERGNVTVQDWLKWWRLAVSSKEYTVDYLRELQKNLNLVSDSAGEGADNIERLEQRQYYQMAATELLKGNTAGYEFYKRLGDSAGAAADQVDRLVAAMMRSYGASVADADVGLMGDLGMGAPAPSTGQWKPFSSRDPGLASYRERKYYKGKWIYRASGGEVGTGGDSYIVGERGPEVFSPRTPGHVTSNSDLGALSTSIERMVKTLPTILIDAIERSK